MAKYTKQQLWEMYYNLPEELQKEASSEETTNSIYKIGNTHGLSNEENYLLTKYVGYVMLGVLPPDKFAETIKRDLKLTEINSEEIAQGINRVVFLPIKNLLQGLYTPITSPIESGLKKEEIPKKDNEEISNEESEDDPYKEEF
jgi:hypothetical protein